MFKILLSGCCGKMGTVISNLVSEFPNLEIIAGIDKFPGELSYPVFTTPGDVNIEYDVLLDFSNISTLHSLLELTEKTKKPLVICSTGYSEEDLNLINEKSKSLPLFKSANMSLGINLINSLLRKVTPLLYGNYDIIVPQKQLSTDIINITYTGIINEDRGVFKIIQAMEKLPENYQLHILGFGDEKNISRLLEEIGLSNKKAGIQRIFYYGTKAGKEYSDFLADKHIGVSLISQNEDICNNAFPGKILSYLGHSLYVLSSSCNSICNSRLGNWLYYCDNSVESIAESILRIPIYQECRSSEILKELQKQFKLDFSKMISKIQENNNGH